MTDNEYEIGYKKPPKKTRFKPGVSGNPKGRPPQKPVISPKKIYDEILGKQKSVLMNGKKTKANMTQISFMKLSEAICRGEKWAIKYLAELTEKYGDFDPYDYGFRFPYIPTRKEFAEMYKDELDEPDHK